MSRLARLLDMREHEIVPCFMFSVLNFLIMAGIFLGRAVRDSLFFIEVGAEWLPLAFVFNAIVLIGVSLFFSKLSGIFARQKHRLLYISLWVFTFAIMAFGLVLNYKINSHYYSIVYWIFFIFCEIALFVMMRVFWFFTEDYFTEQQMKRLSPKFVGSGQIGIGIGGVLTLVLVGSIGTENIIFIWFILVLAGLYVSVRILKRVEILPIEVDEIEDAEEGSIFDGLRIVKKSKYLQLFVIVTICAFIVASIFEVVLASTAEDYFKGDVDKLTFTLGLITIIFGFGAAAFQFLFMSRIIRKLGVGDANLCAPTLLVLGSLALMPFSFMWAAVSRIFFLGNEYLFNQTIIVLIYNAVKEEQRGKVSFFIEGSVVNGTIGVAGAAIFIYTMFFSIDKLAYIAIIFSVLMLVSSYLLKNEYMNILIDNLGAKPPEDRNLMLRNAVGLGDKKSENIIDESLNSADETTAIVAMDIVTEELKDEPNKDRMRGHLDIVSRRIDDENKSIRLAAIKMIIEFVKDEDNIKDNYFKLITEKLVKDQMGNIRLKFSDRETINAILDVYTAWDVGITPDFETLLSKLKKCENREIVGDLIRHLKDMGFTGIFNSIQILHELRGSHDSTDLKIVNRAFGEIGEEAFHKDLTDLCSNKLEYIGLIGSGSDGELEQLQEIIKAFGKIDYKNDKKAAEAFKLLIECFREPVLRKDAAQSLENLFEKKPFLFNNFIELYEDSGWKIELIREIPGIVRSIKPEVVTL